MSNLIEVKSEVLCRKNILICDPALNNMNETRWLFEVESLRSLKERADQEKIDALKFIKKSVVNMLGLNLMPMVDEETGLLRRPEEDEIYPLVAAIGREDFIKALSEKYEELTMQEEVIEEMGSEGVRPGSDPSLDHEELDDFMGDIEFVDDPVEYKKKAVWNSKITKDYINNNVLPLDDKIDDFDGFERMMKVKTNDRISNNDVIGGGRIKKKKIVIDVEPESDLKFEKKDG